FGMDSARDSPRCLCAMGELSEFPSAMRAGTTLKVRRSYPSYPADQGWTATLDLADRSALHKNATADGADFIFTLDVDDTDPPFLPGFYRGSVLVTKVG